MVGAAGWERAGAPGWGSAAERGTRMKIESGAPTGVGVGVGVGVGLEGKFLEDNFFWP